MQRTMLSSKIHRAIVTGTDLGYEGSITIDETLLLEADILPYEKVDIYNVTNGERFSTYVIKGKADSGVICLNGAAARKAMVGDIIIIASYVIVSSIMSSKQYLPKCVLVDNENKIVYNRK